MRGGLADSVLIPAGPALIGADAADAPGSLDNERPRHAVELAAFRIGRVPVTIAEWLEFIADGGYRERRWWYAGRLGPPPARAARRRRCSGHPTEPAAGRARRFGVTEAVPPGRAGAARRLLRGAGVTPAGPARGCPPSWNGRRLPRACPAAAHRSWPWGQRPDAPRPISAATRCGPLRPAPTRRAPASTGSSSCSATSGSGPRHRSRRGQASSR